MRDAKSVQQTEDTKNEREEALERFHVIRPFLEDSVPLAQIARERTIPIRTLSRWVKKYRDTGIQGLTRRTRADKGEPRGIPAKMKSLIEGLALEKPRRSVASIHRRLTRVAQEQGWPIPSYSQVAAIIDALDPGLMILAHEGSKVCREQFDLLYRFEAQAPNQLWQADHTLLPIWLLNERGKPDRPSARVQVVGHSARPTRLARRREPTQAPPPPGHSTHTPWSEPRTAPD
jgi:putative transposase